MLKCIVFEINGKNNMTVENVGKTKVFSAVMWFFPLISKTMHLSKKVLGIFFEEYC